MNQLNLDNLLGEDLFTATQKREIRKNISSYIIKKNKLDPKKSIDVFFRFKNDHLQRQFFLEGNNLNKVVITDAYKAIVFLFISFNLKTETDQSVFNKIIKDLNLKKIDQSSYVIKFNGSWFGLSKLELFEKTKAADLFSAYCYIEKINKDKIFKNLLRKVNNLFFK